MSDIANASESAPEDLRVRHRRIERHGAAVIRAVSGETQAEFRGHRLRVADDRVRFASPWLIADPSTGTIRRNRGVADGLGLRLRHSDAALHVNLSPAEPLAEVVFDLLEQLRCEAQAPDTSRGMRSNLQAAFEDWAVDTEAMRISESGLGLLLYTVTIMTRTRLIGGFENEAVEAAIENTRASIAPRIGDLLYRLSHAKSDQAAFAIAALELADTVDEIAGRPTDDKRSSSSVARRTGLTIPAAWDETSTDGDLHADVGSSIKTRIAEEQEPLDSIGGYHVYTRAYDRESTGTELFPASRRLALRRTLDRQVAAQSVSVHRLAYSLQRLLGRPTVDGWNPLEDEGVLDPARLGQLVARPEAAHVFRTPRFQPTSPAVVTFLIDQSGSMKRQRFETVAVLIDTFCRALDLAGAKSEVLGFTTGDWNGGRALKEWRRVGAADEPGRLAETLHIVYKDAEQPWRRARTSLAAMMDSRHFREGVDGEALAWAYRRLLARPEEGRLLVFVSDGAPFESATANNNRPAFLDDHIQAVAHRIERDPRVELGGIGIDLDLSPYLANTVSLDLTGTLGLKSYQVLEMLFGPGRTKPR